MITVKAIEINGGLAPKTNETKGFGSHCDGVNFYFFENDEERESYSQSTETPL